MAITRTELQVTWSAGSSIALPAGGAVESDELSLDADCIAAQITLKADNASGSPASADIVVAWILQTSGDPDGSGADEFDTPNSVHAVRLGALDTSFEDPVIITRQLPLPQKQFKIRAEGESFGSANTITVSATITQQKAA